MVKTCNNDKVKCMHVQKNDPLLWKLVYRLVLIVVTIEANTYYKEQQRVTGLKFCAAFSVRAHVTLAV